MVRGNSESERRVRAITSASASRRIARAMGWLVEREAGEEVLILGGTQDGANELARQVVERKGAAFGWHRLTLPRLAGIVAARELSARGLIPLSRLAAQAIASRVVHRLRTEEALGRYQTIANTPGLARAFHGVFEELRLARLTPTELSDGCPELVAPLEAYEAELTAGGLIDWAGVLSSATLVVSEQRGAAHPLVGLPTLLLDVPITSLAEQGFLRALAATAPELLITAPTADELTLRRVRSELGVSVEDLDDKDEGIGPSSLTRLQRHLFNDSTHVGSFEGDDRVQIFSAPGEGRECVEIARSVLRAAKEGVPFDRIAILLRSPGTYRSYLEEAFARAGIPAHFARGAIRPDPAGRAFYALLRCAAEGLSARRFAEYLSLGQVPDASPDGAPPGPRPSADRWVAPDPELVPPFLATASSLADETENAIGVGMATEVDATAPVKAGQLRAPRRWERLLVEAAVIGGRDRWRRRLEGRKNEERQRLSELQEEDQAAADAIQRRLEDLSALEAYALPLIDELDQLPPVADWGEWLDRLSALATRSLREPDRVLAVLSELAPMAPVGPIAFGEVLQTLETLLLEVAVAPSAQRYGRVFIGPVEAVRGLSFEVVYVPGLAEKMFPRKIVEEPILRDAIRERVSADLETNHTRLEQERLALVVAAGAAERRICFSYPRLDLEQARPRVPSFYGLEAIRAAEGQLPNFTEFAERAETSTEVRLGWPAPVDPADAIDDAEHDLAILARLADRSDESAGAARYLLAANTHLARALRARARRWGPKWTSSDGMLGQSAEAKTILKRHAFGLRGYSPTALQNYSGCPYRFFLQAIQRLAPREVPEAIDELDPLQRGSLIHEVQFELLTRLSEQRALPVRPANLEQARQVLDEVMDQLAASYRDLLAPAIDRVWEDGIAAIRADLREWLRRASEDDSGYVPWHFELSFGLEHREERRRADPESIPRAVDLDCGIQLRGSIDLVERHPTGSVRVTDHKTGKPTKQIVVTGGAKTLQPLFYALAAEKIFAGRADVKEGRLYFCTSRGGYEEQSVPLDVAARSAAAEIATTIGDAIAEPFLPAAPDKNACENCDFRIVCGPYEERRVARKPTGKLEPLLTLRGAP